MMTQFTDVYIDGVMQERVTPVRYYWLQHEPHLSCTIELYERERLQGSHTLAQFLSLRIPWDFPGIFSYFPEVNL